jgi:hypothetical protein
MAEKRHDDDLHDDQDAIEDIQPDAGAADDIRGGYRGRYALRLDEASSSTQPQPQKK